jgi:hypothetical protein
VICRDRGDAYAEAARQGTPAALQVADRFHLVRNSSDVLQHILARHSAALHTLGVSPVPAESTDTAMSAFTGTYATTGQTATQEATQTARRATGERRRARYDQAVAFRAQGGVGRRPASAD